MRRGYSVIVPRCTLAKISLERLLGCHGLHGFTDAAPTTGDTTGLCAEDAGDPSVVGAGGTAVGCTDETDLFGRLIGRKCLLQWTL
jgi:hypothetical protein